MTVNKILYYYMLTYISGFNVAALWIVPSSVRNVNHCPTDAASWNKAAERMDCQSIEQNCSNYSGLNSNFVFQYHCLVNGWMNATVEVCAYNRTILGKNVL